MAPRQIWLPSLTWSAVVAEMLTLPRVIRARAFIRVVKVSMSYSMDSTAQHMTGNHGSLSTHFPRTPEHAATVLCYRCEPASQALTVTSTLTPWLRRPASSSVPAHAVKKRMEGPSTYYGHCATHLHVLLLVQVPKLLLPHVSHRGACLRNVRPHACITC